MSTKKGDRDVGEATKQTVVNEVCSNINERMMRQKNIGVFKLPEDPSTTKEDQKQSDIEHTHRICQTTMGRRNIEVNVRRLGAKETDGNEGEARAYRRARPILVQFETEQDKVEMMKNLYKLGGSAAPYNKISIRQDMTRTERKADKKLQNEAKSKNEETPEGNFIFQVRGPPWDRKVVKIRKKGKESEGRVEIPQPTQTDT